MAAPGKIDFSSAGSGMGCPAEITTSGRDLVASQFFKDVLAIYQSNELPAPKTQSADRGTLPALAVASAGLALIQQDPGIAAEAAALTREMKKMQNWQWLSHRRLMDLRLQEPDGRILQPLQEILATGSPAG